MVEHSFDQGYKVGVYTTLSGMKYEDVIRLHNLPFMYFTLHLPDADGAMNLVPTPKYLQVLSKVIETMDVQKMCIGKLHPLVEEYTGPVEDGSPGLISRAGLIKTLTPNRKTGKIRCSAMQDSSNDELNHNIVLPKILGDKRGSKGRLERIDL